MSWTIDYTDTALAQLQKLDRQTARRILDYMSGRVSALDDARSRGRALTGPLGGLWRYRVGDYRVVCEVRQTARRVLVLRVGHRRRVYRR